MVQPLFLTHCASTICYIKSIWVYIVDLFLAQPSKLMVSIQFKELCKALVKKIG